MADKPIIFSAPMVQALLDGRKVQTRRTVQNLTFDPISQMWRFGGVNSALLFRSEDQVKSRTDGVVSAKAAAYRKGDRLWCRENWQTHCDMDHITPRDLPHDAAVQYPATYDGWVSRVRPSIHMPRWASRLTLIVTDVRVERLQDISEADAQAEGIIYQPPTEDDLKWYEAYAEEHCFDPVKDPMSGVWIAPGTRQGFAPRPNDPQWGPTASFAFRCLWDSINGPDAWAQNPFVYAITFTVHKSNIDALKAEAA
jgi:hypothetical protein